MTPRVYVVAIVAVAAAGLGVFSALDGWPPAAPLLLAGAAMVTVGVALVDGRDASAVDRDALRPSGVLVFLVLLLFGPASACLVAAAVEIACDLGSPARPRQPVALLLSAAAALAAVFGAGLTHHALGGRIGIFAWPGDALPIAAAAVAWGGTRGTFEGLVAPLLQGHRVSWRWYTRLARIVPPYIVGAAVAVALGEIVVREAWTILAVAAVPLGLAGRGYQLGLERFDDDHRRSAVLDAVVQGMCVLDGGGRITLWGDAMERLTGCPRPRALGRTLGEAVPVLADSELSRVVAEVLSTRASQTLPRVAIALPSGVRLLHVDARAVEDGATLLWHDVTDLTRNELMLRRNAERLELAAQGANDGLWEWDLRRQRCYFSPRWSALVGLPAEARSGRPEDWLARVHPDDVDPLRTTLDAHLHGHTDHFEHEHRIRHEDGVYRWYFCRGVVARGADGRPIRVAGSLTARSEGAISPERLKGAGFRDPLTGLANRAVFVEALGRCLAQSKLRSTSDRFAVLYLDLDRFKVVNDSLGHLVGDELLSAVSRRLESCMRPDDVLARLGGDEFAILLHGINDEPQVNAVAFRLQHALSAPFSIGGREVFTTASIGIAFGRAQYANPEELMRDADIAMYHAKAKGKARHEIFDADMHARVRDRLGLENDLRHAVSAHDFEVHYQPIVLLSSGLCVGLESLIRWRRNGEYVRPDTFIPLAEELGLIEPLGTWVLQQACRTFADWRRRFPSSALDYITVNVSSRQLAQQNFLNIVESAVLEAKLRPSELRLEVTETALMDSPHAAATLLRDLRDFGVKIYLDDFGTGYSSLSHLHKLPVDALKIDRSFVRSLQHAGRPAIVESILALARTLNTSVVAEGIETDVQAYQLERLGCTHAQGYLFSRPLPRQAVDALLAENRLLGPKRMSHATPPEPIEVASPSVPFAWPDHVPLRRAPSGDGTAPVLH